MPWATRINLARAARALQDASGLSYAAALRVVRATWPVGDLTDPAVVAELVERADTLQSAP